MELFDLTPNPYAKRIIADDCPEGLKAGDVRYVVAEDVSYCGEGKTPRGLRLVFKRYVWSRYHGFGHSIFKYGMFRFPDGTERSIMARSITDLDPNSLRGKLTEFARKVRAWKRNARIPRLLPIA